jgi:CheY-like chemotaxis protein
MSRGNGGSPIILVVEDVEETRDGIEKLLEADGYRIDPARDEKEAVARALRGSSDLILLSLAGLPAELIAAARRVRERGALNEEVPIVIFCSEPGPFCSLSESFSSSIAFIILYTDR